MQGVDTPLKEALAATVRLAEGANGPPPSCSVLVPSSPRLAKGVVAPVVLPRAAVPEP